MTTVEHSETADGRLPGTFSEVYSDALRGQSCTVRGIDQDHHVEDAVGEHQVEPGALAGEVLGELRAGRGERVVVPRAEVSGPPRVLAGVEPEQR